MSYVLKKYTTPTFSEIYENVTSFINAYKSSPLYLTELTDATLTIIYNLMLSRYGESPIYNNQADIFKIKFYSLLFQYAPTWQKKLSIQATLRGLTESELIVGTTTIYNRASNPETAPTTETLDELTYINDQNTQKFKRNKSQAYTELYQILRDDITEDFMRKFKILFRNIVAGDYVYVEEEE